MTEEPRRCDEVAGRGLTPERADAAALAAAIERWSSDLALSEEPAGFLRALADGAP